MSRWFRWYEGTSEDGKFRVVARMSRVTVRDVIALWAFMLEDAAHLDHRGVCKRNEVFMAGILDFEDGVVERILEAMENADMISVGMGEITVRNWGKRQFEGDADPTAAERQRRKRERDKSVSHVSVTRDSLPPETETETETNTEKKEDSSLRSDDRAAKVSNSTRETSIADDWPKDYRDQFWSKYPRKVARKSAFKALDKIRKSREVSFSRLMAGIEKIPIGEPVFIPHPATWLNAGRWDDEQYEPIGGFNGKPKRSVQDAAADLVGRMREFDRPPPGGIRSGEGGSVVGLLSKG